ncbi:hypothetical protein MTR_6g037870 [Medicago truncatula]|uniref:Uncharacterized protein n=1 Tax=Medicago truncatula TaxID=3880 RepID=A0A072U8F5_MEDTR|nr:hypothetical protein MTR_6g037870 [Medicago truncatula]
MFLSLQGTLPFARGKIPVKRTKALANGTFVREKTRGRWPGKSAHRKRFARGYTPGRKTRGRTPGKRQRFLPGRTPGMSPHFRLQLSCTTDTTDTSAPALTEVTTAKNEGQSEGFNPCLFQNLQKVIQKGPGVTFSFVQRHTCHAIKGAQCHTRQLINTNKSFFFSATESKTEKFLRFIKNTKNKTLTVSRKSQIHQVSVFFVSILRDSYESSSLN